MSRNHLRGTMLLLPKLFLEITIKSRPLRRRNPAQLRVIPCYLLRRGLVGGDRLLLGCERGMPSRLHATCFQDDAFHDVALADFTPSAIAGVA